jgi:Transcriptional regulator, AbiEi antitoxin
MHRYQTLAERQHSVITRRQLLEIGYTPRQVEGLVRRKELVLLHRGVYRMAGGVQTFEQGVLAACLAVGGYASGRCAATLWKLRKFERADVEVLVARSHTPRRNGIAVRRTTRLRALDRTTLGAIPITSRARTLLDLAAVAPNRVEGAMDGALYRKQVRLPLLQRTMDSAPLRHPGRLVFERLVTERLKGRRPTESELEDDLLAVLRGHGLPEPIPQHEANGRRIDLAYPEFVLGIEADSVEAHAARDDVQRNATKANDLLGWWILHFTWDDVHRRPAYVAAAVADALRRRAAVAA